MFPSAITLAVSALGLNRGVSAIFGGVSFTVAAGGALILRGSNGSGKTSLLRCLAGLTLPDAGGITWNGENWPPLSEKCRATTLYLGHTHALKDDFTAQENLSDALAIDNLLATPDAQRDALLQVGLADRRDVLARRLSQGQKRRVGMARLVLALSQAPHPPQKPLWLLDEPTNALDADGVLLFTHLINAHLARGGLACIATHLALDLAKPATVLNLDQFAGGR